MQADAPIWLREAVSTFSEECRRKLNGPGDREAAIRAPLESLLSTAGAQLGVDAVFHDEDRKPRYSLGGPGMPAADDDQTTLDL